MLINHGDCFLAARDFLEKDRYAIITQAVSQHLHRQIPFKEAKLGILQELGQKKAEGNYQKWLNDLKGKAKVKINKKWLRS